MIAALIAVSVTVNPGSYQGNYFVDSESGGPWVGTQTFDLAAGTHFIDDGVFAQNAAGTSAFAFSVDAAGNVTVDPTYAVGGAGSLTFNTCAVNVNAGAYTARWFGSSEHTTPQQGNRTFQLIPALLYWVDDGAFAQPAGMPSSGFDYGLDGACNVIGQNPLGSVAASGNSVFFNTISIAVTPNPSGTSYLWSGDNVDALTGTQSLVFIGGTTSYIVVAGQPLYFVPGPQTLTFTSATVTLTQSTSTAVTPAGTGVPVQPATAVSLNFGTVSTSGTTSVSVSGTGAPPPAGFKLIAPPAYYDISTTATYSGTITVCIDINGANSPQLFHFESGAWVNLNGTIVGSQICGTVTSLSPFAVFDHAQVVAIDIKPGSAGTTTIQISSRGNVAVAVLSSASFDATTVDPATVEIASAPVRTRKNGSLMASIQDVNGDGLPDLVMQFITDELQLAPGNDVAVLTGATYDGLAITGSSPVHVIQ
jgi:hypothetical protein